MENKSGITPTLAISCEDFEKIKNSIEEKDKEIERLNNIINELEKWLEERSGDVSFAYHHALNKLQELKGSDNNE